jgi:methylmalonyl-CoA mutase C-terminal domain/subunit
MNRKKRIVLGKLGLDSHDNGLRIVAKWLMDSGYEVIYTGLYNTPEKMIKIAAQEDADGIGISFLGGEHLHYARELIDTLHAGDMAHIKVLVGGVIPPDDVSVLRDLGVSAVFTPGTRKQRILDLVHSVLSKPGS